MKLRIDELLVGVAGAGSSAAARYAYHRPFFPYEDEAESSRASGEMDFPQIQGGQQIWL